MSETPSVSYEEVVRGARLALDNGGALIEDARALSEAGRYPRAIALAILAMEEFGKIPRMLQIKRFADAGRMKEWWRYFRDHHAKSGLNALVSATRTTSDEEMAKLPDGWQVDFAAHLDGIKFRALYVDFLEGSFVSPNDLDGAVELARQMILFAAASYEGHEEHLSMNLTEADSNRAHKAMETFMANPDLLEAFLADKPDSPAARTLRHLLSRMRKRAERERDSAGTE